MNWLFISCRVSEWFSTFRPWEGGVRGLGDNSAYNTTANELWCDNWLWGCWGVLYDLPPPPPFECPATYVFHGGIKRLASATLPDWKPWTQMFNWFLYLWSPLLCSCKVSFSVYIRLCQSACRNGLPDTTFSVCLPQWAPRHNFVSRPVAMGSQTRLCQSVCRNGLPETTH